MTQRPNLRELVDEAASLYDVEVMARENGRLWELDPNPPPGEPAGAFAMAEAYRNKRLAILRRARLL